MPTDEEAVVSTRLAGTVALVTGASSGIGEATARSLAAEGASVAIVARRLDRLNALADSIGDQSRVEVIEADVTDEDQARSMVDRTVSRFGRLDTLVNNAGRHAAGPDRRCAHRGVATDGGAEPSRTALLHSYCFTLTSLLRLSPIPRRVADVVNVSSVAGRVARTGNGVYSATKFGVVAFGESLRQEVAARHVRVTAVEPGATATELAGHNRPEILEGMRGTFSGIELLKSEDIADAIVYAVTRPRHVALNELLVRPTEQER